jgi:hypothetical protein
MSSTAGKPPQPTKADKFAWKLRNNWSDDEGMAIIGVDKPDFSPLAEKLRVIVIRQSGSIPSVPAFLAMYLRHNHLSWSEVKNKEWMNKMMQQRRNFLLANEQFVRELNNGEFNRHAGGYLRMEINMLLDYGYSWKKDEKLFRPPPLESLKVGVDDAQLSDEFNDLGV